MQRSLLLGAALLLAVVPVAGQAPRAGSLAIGLGFGFNTTGSVGVDASARYMASDRVAVGCRLSRGWGGARVCGTNLYPSPNRDWHLVAEVGRLDAGVRVRDRVPVRRIAWFVNLGGGVEERIENDRGGHYRDSRVHFIIGPTLLVAERSAPPGEAAPLRWGVSPQFFNHTEFLLYPILR